MGVSVHSAILIMAERGWGEAQPQRVNTKISLVLRGVLRLVETIQPRSGSK
jgi:hypothetical protein